VVFAFQTSGGRRENGIVVSIHMGGGKLTAGSLSGDKATVTLLSQVLRGTRMKLAVRGDMDAWLKSHAAFVLPIAFVCYAVDGKLKRAARDRAMLGRAIDAMDEAYRMLEACGVSVPPEDVDFVRRQRRRCYWFIKVLAATPMGRLAASDHAMNAKDEMRRLYEDFLAFKQKAGIETPAWDELERFMPKV
jgi:2-dehydropantoate 2-reductase